MSRDDRQRFSALFDQHYGVVHAYAMRRTDPETAKEVAAETFLVAWQRLQDVPGHPVPWLLVVARNTLSNHRRGEYRRMATESAAAWLSRVRSDDVSVADGVSERLAVLSALAQLTERDRETLMLVAWDGLAPAEAATVAGCTTATFHVRLHRARARLTALLGDDRPPGPVERTERTEPAALDPARQPGAAPPRAPVRSAPPDPSLPLTAVSEETS